MTVVEKIRAGKPVGVREFAAEAGVSGPTVYRAIESGTIPVIRIGKRMTVPAHIARKLLHLPDADPAAA